MEVAAGGCEAAAGPVLLFGLVSSLLRGQCDVIRSTPRAPPSPVDVTEFDFVIVGAGSAGCVLANRLSEVAAWRVLLIEAGGDPPPGSQVPGLMETLLDSEVDWRYLTSPQRNSCLGQPGRRCKFPRGRLLGGSSSINRMKYVRGNRRDYDRWAAMGNPGWSYREVLPYFLKSENNLEFGHDSQHHALGGLLTVERFRFHSPLSDAVIQAGGEIGYPMNLDINGAYQAGFMRAQATHSEGLRMSTAQAFLRPALHRSNLEVITHAHVTRVLLDGNRAVGVEFLKNGHKMTVFATREVILSAGAFNSPQLLMLSGIGPADHLREVGIPVRVDLPGVGGNLQDHFSVPVAFYTEARGPISEAEFVSQYLLRREGPLSSTGLSQNTGFLSSSGAKVSAWPDIQVYFASFPVLCTMENGLDRCEYQDFPPDFLMAPALLRPFSHGRVSLASNDPLMPPIIDPNYLSDDRDVATLLGGIRSLLRLAHTKTLQNAGVYLNQTQVTGCRGHLFDSDQYWECVMRTWAVTCHHPSGTCRMGNDSLAVVDPELRVYGVDGLRVVDASVMPSVISGNTNAPTIMIAEKAADLIKNTWR